MRRLALVCAVLTSSGCAHADGMTDKLYDATRAYNRALRWGDFDRAAEYVPPESSDDFLDEHQKLDEELVILDWEMTRLKLDKQTGTAADRVQIQWHTDRELIVETTTVDQTWQFYEGSWYLVDERRVDGTPLDVFAETEEADHPYLPGLELFRDLHEIGLDDAEKRKRARARKRAAKKNKKAAVAAQDDVKAAPDLDVGPDNMPTADVASRF